MLLGFIVILVAMPPRGYENGLYSSVRFVNYGAARYAGLFVFAVISLFCALNTLADRHPSQKEQWRNITWTGAMLAWTLFLLIILLKWWLQLDDFLKPSWFNWVF